MTPHWEEADSSLETYEVGKMQEPLLSDEQATEDAEADLDAPIFSKRQVQAVIDQVNADVLGRSKEMLNARAEGVERALKDTQMKLEATEKEVQPRPGEHVRIMGLQKRSDLNGKEARVVSCRYECELFSDDCAGTTFGCRLENLELRKGDAEERASTFSTPSLSRLNTDDDDARASGVHGPLGQSLLTRAMGAGRMRK